jgi:Ankyrin repeats (3 copies)
MNIPKDLYENLSNYADDKTILNMLSVNKKFRDEEFFQRILIRKYPLLIPFKKDTWRELYIRMTYYIAKLEENFGIPYIPTKGYNPEFFYKGYKDRKDRKDIFDRAMAYAALGGHMGIVKLMIEKGATDFDWAMVYAARGGHMEIVKLMIEKGATNFDWGMKNAAEGGHMDIVKLMIEKGATDFDWSMRSAAEGGHMEIVKLMIEKGATVFDLAMNDAAKGGHMEIVNYLKQFVK